MKLSYYVSLRCSFLSSASFIISYAPVVRRIFSGPLPVTASTAIATAIAAAEVVSLLSSEQLAEAPRNRSQSQSSCESSLSLSKLIRSVSLHPRVSTDVWKRRSHHEEISRESSSDKRVMTAALRRNVNACHLNRLTRVFDTGDTIIASLLSERIDTLSRIKACPQVNTALATRRDAALRIHKQVVTAVLIVTPGTSFAVSCPDNACFQMVRCFELSQRTILFTHSIFTVRGSTRLPPGGSAGRQAGRQAKNSADRSSRRMNAHSDSSLLLNLVPRTICSSAKRPPSSAPSEAWSGPHHHHHH